MQKDKANPFSLLVLLQPQGPFRIPGVSVLYPNPHSLKSHLVPPSSNSTCLIPQSPGLVHDLPNTMARPCFSHTLFCQHYRAPPSQIPNTPTCVDLNLPAWALSSPCVAGEGGVPLPQEGRALASGPSSDSSTCIPLLQLT